MADLDETETPTTEAVQLQRREPLLGGEEAQKGGREQIEEQLQYIEALLGGPRVLRQHLRNSLDAHEMLLGGLPRRSVAHLIGNLVVIQRRAPLEKAVGMSLRTMQRHKGTPDKPLSPERSAKAWKFAEILAKATKVFGSQEEAERWLERPAIGLDRRRPIDLLATPAGIEMVEDFLHQLEYGVYV
jgi:putative toxin-antitoxin system antitoxin component (TIGR02293 family)